MRKEIVDYLMTRQKVRVYDPGEIIFSQGDAATEFFYFVSGLSLTYTIFPDGRERNILITWPDRIFGASTFFEGAPRRASAIAIKRCEVLTIGRALYRDCCERFPDFYEELIREISTDLGTLFDELADATLLNADVRVARFLCRRFANGQQEGSDEAPVFNYTQNFISDVLGISRVSVSTALSQLSVRGWLTTNYGKIIVTDPKALRVYAYGAAER